VTDPRGHALLSIGRELLGDTDQALAMQMRFQRIVHLFSVSA
jgi:hypothetical protein